jgi:peptide/nickel transport system substrate-binding protein/oligopeptide transport system substrate-binding protein
MSRTCAALVIVLGLMLPAGAFAAVASGTSAPEEFVVAFNSLDLDFDPHHAIYSAEAQVFTAIYEGLFTYNPSTLEPVKSACSSFTKSGDGLTYTFYIRDNAKWSDGSPLLARDFRDAWLRALSPAEKADYASFFDIIAGAKDYRSGIKADPATVGVSVIDDRVLQVKLASPAAYFTRLLCHHSFSPIHPSMLKAGNWTGALPFPVNGPYRIESYRKGELILAKSESYWDSASVAIPRIRAVFTDDDLDVTRRFDSGEMHWLAGPMDIASLLDRGAIQTSPMFGTQYWYFDCGAKPWDKPELRRALALLLPWQEIRAKEAYFMPAETLVLPFDSYDKATGIKDQDEKEAAALLAKAGYPGGKGLPPIVILAPDGSSDATRVTDIMKKSWEKTGEIKVEVRKISSDEYVERLRLGQPGGDFTLALQTWIGDFADPLAFLGMFSSDSNLNEARFSDADYDSLLQKASVKDGDERLKLLAEAESELLAGAAVLPLYHILAANIVDTEFVEGWYMNALDIHPFKYLAFGERSVRPNVAMAY